MSNSLLNSQEQEDDNNEELEINTIDNTYYPKFTILSLKQLINIERKANKNKKIGIDLSNTKYDVINEICKEFNWNIYKNNPSIDNWHVSWHDFYIQEDYLRKMQPYQKINRFPGSYNLGKKNYLGKHLTKMRKKYEKEYDFVPRTWVLPHQYEELKQFNQNCLQQNPKNKNVYIVKPESSCQGKGIFLTKKIENTLNPNDHYVVQEYIKNPYLVDNLKFDFRLYVLVKSIKPLKIFLYREGLTRFATTEYKKPNKKNMSQLTMHLTNYAVNKKSKDFVFNQKDFDDGVGHKRSFSSVLQILQEQGKNTDKLMMQIRKLIIKTLCCVQPYLSHLYKSGQSKDEFSEMCFEVFGFDIMIDKHLKPYLIEVNHTPSFQTDTPLDYQIKKNLIIDTLILVNIKNKAKKKYFENKEKNILYLKGQTNKISQEDMEKLNQKILNYENKHLNGYLRIFPFLKQKDQKNNNSNIQENNENEKTQDTQNNNQIRSFATDQQNNSVKSEKKENISNYQSIFNQDDLNYIQNYYEDEEDYEQYMKQAKIIQDEFTGVKQNKNNNNNQENQNQNLPPRPPTSTGVRQNSLKIIRRPQSGIVKPISSQQSGNSQANSSFSSQNNNNNSIGNDSNGQNTNNNNIPKKDFISMNKKNLIRFSRQNKNQTINQPVFQENDISPQDQQFQINQYKELLLQQEQQKQIQLLQYQQSLQNSIVNEKEFCNVDGFIDNSFNFVNSNNNNNYNNNNLQQTHSLSQQIQNTCNQDSNQKLQNQNEQYVGSELSCKLNQLKIELKSAQDEAQYQIDLQKKFNSQTTTHNQQYQQENKQLQQQQLLLQNKNLKTWKVQNNNFVMKNLYQQNNNNKNQFQGQSHHSHSHSTSRDFGNINNNNINNNVNEYEIPHQGFQIFKNSNQYNQIINNNNNLIINSKRNSNIGQQVDSNRNNKQKSQNNKYLRSGKHSFGHIPYQQQQQQQSSFSSSPGQNQKFYDQEDEFSVNENNQSINNNLQKNSGSYYQTQGEFNVNKKNLVLTNNGNSGSTYQYQMEKDSQQKQLSKFQKHLMQTQQQQYKKQQQYKQNSGGFMNNSYNSKNKNLINNNPSSNFQLIQNATKIQSQINSIYKKNNKKPLVQQQMSQKDTKSILPSCKLLNKQEKQGMIQFQENQKKQQQQLQNSQKQYYQNINIVKQQYYNK